MKKRTLCALVLAQSSVALACDYHLSLNQLEPTPAVTTADVWSTAPQATPAVASRNLSLMTTASSITGPVTAAVTITDPAITSWKQNTTGAKGNSTNAQINSYVSSITADVDKVAYDSTFAYMHSSGVPSHNVGPFAGNPAYPANQNRTSRIPRVPQVNSGTKTATGLGNIGVMVNGVGIFNARDAASYNNLNTWHQNANVFELASFDNGRGHPAPGMQQPQQGQLVAGNYHYHQAPLQLINQLDPGNSGQHHSPLIGFAFDGFPIYGPYGYANGDGTGGIVRETTSYQKRNITQRHSLAGSSSDLASNLWGPDVSDTYPLGGYVEDYEYVSGSGTLDQYNGRFTITPEYPKGTFAYFVTVNPDGSAAYPYIIGPTYYGVVDTANLGMNAANLSIPGTATLYTVPEPVLGAVMLPMLLGLRRRRQS
ncbi:MAG TPA: YHYH protein [Tepidisphaeraceae bacterium]|jgi:hypothetical protein